MVDCIRNELNYRTICWFQELLQTARKSVPHTILISCQNDLGYCCYYCCCLSHTQQCSEIIHDFAFRDYSCNVQIPCGMSVYNSGQLYARQVLNPLYYFSSAHLHGGLEWNLVQPCARQTPTILLQLLGLLLVVNRFFINYSYISQVYQNKAKVYEFYLKT